MMIRRDNYLNQLISYRGTKSVKVVTGIRRCGKSFLLLRLYVDYLFSIGVETDHILTYSMDMLDYENLRNKRVIYNDIKSRISNDGLYYVIIDEIQYIEDFYEVLNSLLHYDNVDVYVTGSNSKFLSSDIVTEFRGRSVEIRVHPLSFSEFVSAKGEDPRDCIQEYMDYGGMPELFQYDSPKMKTDYLKNLMMKVYLTDIVERCGIRNESNLEDITDLLCSSVGSLNSITKITNTLKTKKGSTITDKTVKTYIDCLCDCYMFERCMRYDVKGRKYFDAQCKYYTSDVGLKNVRENFRQAEETHIMENIIYNELRTRGYDVDVGAVSVSESIDGKRKCRYLEVDFVANCGNERVYVQSALTLGEDNLERELRPFLKVNDSFKKVLITGGSMTPRLDENGIMRMGLLYFLMNDKSLNW